MDESDPTLRHVAASGPFPAGAPYSEPLPLNAFVADLFSRNFRCGRRAVRLHEDHWEGVGTLDDSDGLKLASKGRPCYRLNPEAGSGRQLCPLLWDNRALMEIARGKASIPDAHDDSRIAPLAERPFFRHPGRELIVVFRGTLHFEQLGNNEVLTVGPDHMLDYDTSVPHRMMPADPTSSFRALVVSSSTAPLWVQNHLFLDPETDRTFGAVLEGRSYSEALAEFVNRKGRLFELIDNFLVAANGTWPELLGVFLGGDLLNPHQLRGIYQRMFMTLPIEAYLRESGCTIAGACDELAKSYTGGRPIGQILEALHDVTTRNGRPPKVSGLDEDVVLGIARGEREPTLTELQLIEAGVPECSGSAVTTYAREIHDETARLSKDHENLYSVFFRINLKHLRQSMKVSLDALASATGRKKAYWQKVEAGAFRVSSQAGTLADAFRIDAHQAYQLPFPDRHTRHVESLERLREDLRKRWSQTRGLPKVAADDADGHGATREEVEREIHRRCGGTAMYHAIGPDRLQGEFITYLVLIPPDSEADYPVAHESTDEFCLVLDGEVICYSDASRSIGDTDSRRTSHLGPLDALFLTAGEFHEWRVPELQRESGKPCYVLTVIGPSPHVLPPEYQRRHVRLPQKGDVIEFLRGPPEQIRQRWVVLGPWKPESNEDLAPWNLESKNELALAEGTCGQDDSPDVHHSDVYHPERSWTKNKHSSDPFLRVMEQPLHLVTAHRGEVKEQDRLHSDVIYVEAYLERRGPLERLREPDKHEQKLLVLPPHSYAVRDHKKEV